MTRAALPPSAETAYLGRFDPMEAPIVIEILAEHGIFAMTKASATAGPDPYGFDPGRGDVLVDAARAAEARRVVDEELPMVVEELRRSLEETPFDEPAPEDPGP